MTEIQLFLMPDRWRGHNVCTCENSLLPPGENSIVVVVIIIIIIIIIIISLLSSI